MNLHLIGAREIFAAFACISAATGALGTTINFDDVGTDGADLTYRYAELGVTLKSIANTFPSYGAYPVPNNLPAIQGGVSTWAFDSSPSQPYSAVSAAIPNVRIAGNGGILISFSSNVNFVSLIGNDLGTGLSNDDSESVTLAAYDANGKLIAQSYTREKLLGEFDQVYASISTDGIRYVSFNYSDSQYGFYAIDNLTFSTSVPEISSLAMISIGLLGIGAARISKRPRTQFIK
jgi:hypothetical protein